MNELRKYTYWLLSNPTISNSQRIKLYNYFGSAQLVFFASEQDLKDSQILDCDATDIFLRHKNNYDLDQEYSRFLCTPFDFITLEDSGYPEPLLYISNTPYGIFYTGDLHKIVSKKNVAIVGARSCSAYGKRMAQELAAELAKNDIAVISGLAKGIDSYAHMGSLSQNGFTAAVLGCGVDVVYPKENIKIYEQIAKTGCIISEYPMGTEPKPRLFPPRNRIISGLSNTVVIVEARIKSGSLITADFALDQGKNIYVVPGRVGDSLSAGCNRLASQGAGIIFSIEDFMKDMLEIDSYDTYQIKSKVNCSPKVMLSQDQLIVYSLFDLYPKSLNEVQQESNMNPSILISNIMELCRIGMLKEVFKNNYIIQ